MTFPELFQAIEERRELIAAASNRVDDSLEEVGAIDQAVEDLIPLGNRFETDDLQKLTGLLHEVLDEMISLEAAAVEDVEHTAEKLIERLHEVVHELDHAVDYLLEAHAQIQMKVFDIEMVLADYEALLEERSFDLSMTFADLADEMGETRHRLQMSALDTQNNIGSFGDQVNFNLTDAIESQFAELRKMVDGLSRNRLPGAFKQYGGTMRESYDRSRIIAEEEADRLSESMRESLIYMIELVEVDAFSAIKSTFSKLIDEAIPSAHQSFDDCQRAMSNGAEIAGAISNWMPALRNIKEMVGVALNAAESA